jgi:hypothetical protein
MKVRILRAEPNSINASSSQFVSVADVSNETALLFEDYRKGRKTLDEALVELEILSFNDRTTVPFSVYVNIHSNHASIFFIQTDLLNRGAGADRNESSRLASMERGLRVYMQQNRFQIINPYRIRRIDLFTENGLEYKIEMNGDILKPGHYDMFKCYEIIGVSDQEIEWAYLMAAQDWYDTATNNCLSFSKRIISELHKQIMNGDELNRDELRRLNKLYISSSSETILDGAQSRLSFFMNPRVLPLVVFFFLLALYVEWRLGFLQKN